MQKVTDKNLTNPDFDFNGNGVQVVMKGQEPWFVAKNIFDVLGLKNSHKAMKRLRDDEKDTVTLSSGKVGNPKKTVISESALYKLALKCHKPVAKKFVDWVTREVLPTIRKTDDTMVRVNRAPDFTLSLVEALEKTCEERDEAIRSRGFIDSKRTATVMGRLGAATKKIKRLEAKPELDSLYKETINMLNSHYAVIWLGEKCLILKETKTPCSEQNEITFISETNLKKHYANRTIPDPANPEKKIKIVDYWLKSPDRRQYEGIVFEPGKEVPEYYNLWTGFPIKPVKGDWSLFQDHIFNIITNGDEDLFRWVMGWMARIIQDPGGERPGTSIVLRGGRGTGKGIFVNCFGRLLGQHYIQIAQQNHLVGRFNKHLENKILVFVDEGFLAGNKQAESALKNMITEPRIVVERKGIDAYTVKNCMNLIMASNDDWVIPAGEDERRFCVTDVSNAHRQDHVYFKAIVDQMENGGLGAMLYDLLEWDYSMAELRVIPKTKALLDQKMYTMDPVSRFWMERLEDETLSPEHEEWTREIGCKILYKNFIKFAKGLKQPCPSSTQQFTRSMKKLCPSIVKAKNESNVDTYRFPKLEDCRTQFESFLGVEGQIPWGEES